MAAPGAACASPSNRWPPDTGSVFIAAHINHPPTIRRRPEVDRVRTSIMTSTAEVGDQVVARARGMLDLVRSEAAGSERQRPLTPAIVDEMWASGLMSSFNPIPAGGVEPALFPVCAEWGRNRSERRGCLAEA